MSALAYPRVGTCLGAESAVLAKYSDTPNLNFWRVGALVEILKHGPHTLNFKIWRIDVLPLLGRISLSSGVWLRVLASTQIGQI